MPKKVDGRFQTITVRMKDTKNNIHFFLFSLPDKAMVGVSGSCIDEMSF